MSAYYFWGLVSSVFFLSAIPAIYHQLRIIWRRKRLQAQGELNESVTQSISLNQIVSSYFGVYSFFLFGLVSETPDPFLTYPRAIVGILLYLVVYELYQDRRSKRARGALLICSLSLLIPLLLLVTGTRASVFARGASHSIVCLAVVLLAQGNIAQYLALKRTQKRGGVSLPMHLVLYGKDFTGMMFGFQIGIGAWSIILMHVSNLIMRAPIIYAFARAMR